MAWIGPTVRALNEHRQTELVRPGTPHIVLGDGIKPIGITFPRVAFREQRDRPGCPGCDPTAIRWIAFNFAFANFGSHLVDRISAAPRSY